MTNEELQQMIELEQSAIDALNECTGYDCVEYDNGTFECDDCPFFKKYCELKSKADSILRG